MTPEERVTEIMSKYDLPTSRDVLRALLHFTYQQGKCDGAEEAADALRKTFERPALPAVCTEGCVQAGEPVIDCEVHGPDPADRGVTWGCQ